MVAAKLGGIAPNPLGAKFGGGGEAIRSDPGLTAGNCGGAAVANPGESAEATNPVGVSWTTAVSS